MIEPTAMTDHPEGLAESVRFIVPCYFGEGEAATFSEAGIDGVR